MKFSLSHLYWISKYTFISNSIKLVWCNYIASCDYLFRYILHSMPFPQGHCIFLNVPSRASLNLFSVFSNKHHYKIYNQLIVKNVHPVYSAAIRTHDLWNMSLLPYPLDQGSLPRSIVLLRKTNETVAGIIPSGWPIFVMHSVGVRNRKIVGTDRSTT